MRRVGFGRSRLYLDLVPRDGPTIVVARKLETAFAAAGRPVDALAGQTIRVRGVLDDRFGPRTRGQRAGDDRNCASLRGARSRQAASMSERLSESRSRRRAGPGVWRRVLVARRRRAVPRPGGLRLDRRPAGAGRRRAGRRRRERRRRRRRSSPERKRLIEAFGGEYHAPADRELPERRSREAGAGLRTAPLSPIASRCSIRRSSTPSPCLRAISSSPAACSRSPTTRPRSPRSWRTRSRM